MRRFAQVAGAVAWRSIHNFASNPAFLLPSIIFPMFFFVAFAGGLSNVGNVPGFDFAPGYTAFQFVFVLMQAAAFGGVFTGFGIASDFERGFARRLLLAAPNRRAIIAGYAIAAWAPATIVGALLFAVAFATGMRVGGDGLDVLTLIALAYLVSLAATLFAAGVAMRARTIQAGPAMQMPVFVVLFLAPVYVPLDLLSGWVHGAASVNPFTPLVQTGRDLIAGSAEPAAAFALAVAARRRLRLVGDSRATQRGGRRRVAPTRLRRPRCRCPRRSGAARAAARTRRTRTSSRAASMSGNSMITKRTGAQLPSSVSWGPPRTMKRPPWRITASVLRSRYSASFS